MKNKYLLKYLQDKDYKVSEELKKDLEEKDLENPPTNDDEYESFAKNANLEKSYSEKNFREWLDSLDDEEDEDENPKEVANV